MQMDDFHLANHLLQTLNIGKLKKKLISNLISIKSSAGQPLMYSERNRIENMYSYLKAILYYKKYFFIKSRKL